jgi:tRNA threonylcarbamoyladenosine biosynthesis protein TsaB
MHATLTDTGPHATPGPFKLLAIETSTHRVSVGALAPHTPEQLWTEEGEGGAQASANLLPMVSHLLARAQLKLSDLDAIVYGRGPGAFTGLRTATAVVQGLAYGTRTAHHPNGLPVLGVDTLLATAEAARHILFSSGELAGDATCVLTALLDARMDELYAAVYQFDDPALPAGTLLAGPSLLKPEALAAWLPAPAQNGWLVGNAMDLYGPRLPHAFQSKHASSDTAAATPSRTLTCWPDAAALLRLAPHLITSGLTNAPASAQPLYVRDQVAKTTAERAADQASGHTRESHPPLKA